MAFPSLPPMAPMPDIPPIDVPKGGMFAAPSGLQTALMAAASGFLARTRPQMAQSMMQGIQDQRTMNRQAQLAKLQSDLEFQRQMQLLPIQARMKLMYPDDAFSQAEFQAGVMPGTPQWLQDHQTHVQNELDPAVLTPQGMMLRSQITGALQPPQAPVGKLTPMGGQTQPASGGFLGAGTYPDIGPYHRY